MTAIDLNELERIARAADKDNPGICYHADHVDGYPIDSSAMALFNAMTPAATLSLIRRIHELEELALLGVVAMETLHDATAGRMPGPQNIARVKSLLARGVIQYGRRPVSNDDRWDIDRPAEDTLALAATDEDDSK